MDATEQADLQADLTDPDFDSDDNMHDVFEAMLEDSELEWLPDGCTGDLTSAPMLGLFGDALEGPARASDSDRSVDLSYGHGFGYCGCWKNGSGELTHWWQPVMKRWAFMNYQITSPQRELADAGRCVWIGGDFHVAQEAAKFLLQEAVNKLESIRSNHVNNRRS